VTISINPGSDRAHSSFKFAGKATIMTASTARARFLAILGTAIFLVFAPGAVVVLIPWWITRWRLHVHFAGLFSIRIFGLLAIAAGSIVVLDSFARFAWQGIGTPAPIYPTRHLVVKGFYRYVRNPMYVSLLLVILGQALFFADARLVAYAFTAWLAPHLFVVFYEEPKLRRTFPDEYARYTAHVPRWIPHLTPWNPDS
jgi:protein-S-isoprenylcysteine O-methyltransferase Ste14